MTRLIIIGASGGIGRALFDTYHSRGMDVVGTYAANPVDHPGFYPCDVSDPVSVDAFFNHVKAGDTSQLVTVCCMGTDYMQYLHKADAADWQRVIDVNLIGAFRIARGVVPLMRRARFGRLVFMSSIVAKRGMPATSAYAASKAGLWGLSSALASENADRGITSNVLDLGYFNVGMIDQVPEFSKDAIKKKIGARAFGTTDNIASGIDFLIKTDYVNGARLPIDGHFQ